MRKERKLSNITSLSFSIIVIILGIALIAGLLFAPVLTNRYVVVAQPADNQRSTSKSGINSEWFIFSNKYGIYRQ